MNVTVPGVAIRASRSVKRSMPRCADSTPISTVTPQTIRITLHGIFLIASFSSAARSSDSNAAPVSAASPTCALELDHDHDQRDEHRERQPVPGFERLDVDDLGIAARAPA